MIREQINELVIQTIKDFSLEENLGIFDVKKSLVDNNLDSLQFVKLIVILEDVFGIEFDDEIYILGTNMNIDYICNKIEKLYHEKGE